MAVTQIRGDSQLQNNTLTNDSLTSRTSTLTLATVSNGDIDLSPNGTGQIDATSHKIKNLTDPTLAQDAATKNYVDSLANGLSWKNAVQAATATSLARYAYNNGTSGVGATLTATANAALVVDGYTVATNDRILVKNETTGTTTQTSTVTSNSFTVASTTGIYVGTILTDTTTSTTSTVTVVNTGTSTVTVVNATNFNNGDSLTWDDQPFNGIYTVTQTGDGSHPYILTRSLDQNTPAEFPAAAVFTQEGSTNADKGYVCTTQPPVTIGTTDITWVLFASTSSSVVAGNGIDVSGNTVSISTDNSLTANSPNSTPSLVVKEDPAGAIVTNTGGIAVQLESSNPTLQISSNKLGVKLDPAGAIITGASGIKIQLDSPSGLQIVSDKLSIQTDTTTANTVGVTTTSNGAGIKISSTNFTDGGTETLTLATAGVLYANTNIINREVPSGSINSSNVTFTLANTPASGSEDVFLNGLLQNVGGGNDYTISGGTITFNSAPQTGSVILVSYWKA